MIKKNIPKNTVRKSRSDWTMKLNSRTTLKHKKKKLQ